MGLEKRRDERWSAKRCISLIRTARPADQKNERIFYVYLLAAQNKMDLMMRKFRKIGVLPPDLVAICVGYMGRRDLYYAAGRMSLGDSWRYAAAFDLVHVLDHVGWHPALPFELILWDATESGSMSILKWADANIPWHWDKIHCNSAAYRNDLDMLKWLRTRDPPCPWDVNAILVNARMNKADASRDMFTWLLSQMTPESR